MPSGGRKSYQTQLNIRIPITLRDALDKDAELMGMSLSDFIRLILASMVDESPDETEFQKAMKHRLKDLKATRAKIRR